MRGMLILGCGAPVSKLAGVRLPFVAFARIMRATRAVSADKGTCGGLSEPV
jgi:hypothetical protein